MPLEEKIFSLISVDIIFIIVLDMRFGGSIIALSVLESGLLREERLLALRLVESIRIVPTLTKVELDRTRLAMVAGSYAL